LSLPAHIGAFRLSLHPDRQTGVRPGTLRDLRVAEVVAQDIHLAEDGGITYRTKLRVSFKYEPGA